MKRAISLRGHVEVPVGLRESERMGCKLRVAGAVALGVLVGACSAGPPPRPPTPVAPPPPPPAVKVPAGCELNLTGDYHLAAPSGWGYAAEDDGSRLVIRLRRAPEGAEPMTLILERTPEGFVGRIEGQATTRGGRRCPVYFQAEIIACTPDRIVVRSEDARSVDENCTPGGPIPPATEKTLVRD